MWTDAELAQLDRVAEQRLRAADYAAKNNPPVPLAPQPETPACAC